MISEVIVGPTLHPALAYARGPNLSGYQGRTEEYYVNRFPMRNVWSPAGALALDPIR